ncbi:MAG: phospho-N-acetylmuramoyl-pentapeptide-transferase [Lentisphaerae bacterium]|nr:phospho-N-acetylmuramoyl-pentapeptide-transferase [Lentisphaerota bacterium]
MFYYLSNFSNHPDWGFLRLFNYVSFRAGCAGVMSLLIVILLGPATVRMLKKFRATAPSRYGGVQILEEFINEQKNKTPSMGGVLILFGIVVSALLWMKPTELMWILTGSTVLLGLLGFADDFAKVAYRNKDGISGKLKLLGQFMVAGAAVIWLFYIPEFKPYMSQLYLPFFNAPVAVGVWVSAFAILAIVGASNAVNLTDGKDGLSSGCMIFATIAYAVIAYLSGHRIFADYLLIPFIPGASEAVVFAAAVIGACIGFLWHNCYPASMFMGDTGSLALGGIIGLLAVLVRQEFLLFLVGGVFVMEIVSVMIQVMSVKLTGKRVFLCTPIHHHFEKMGWTETQIVIRFWILAGIFALLALGTLKLR